jgi:hypothetical protein
LWGAAPPTRVGLVLDGATLYVDHDGSGDLTRADKRLEKPTRVEKDDKTGMSLATYADVSVVERDGKTRHTLTVQVASDGVVTLNVKGPRAQFTKAAAGDSLRAAGRADLAPVVHFNAPLVLLANMRREASDKVGPLTLVRGEQGTVEARLGTPGLGEGTVAYANPNPAAPLPGGEKLGPHGALLEIEYPSGQPHVPPIRLSAPLTRH